MKVSVASLKKPVDVTLITRALHRRTVTGGRASFLPISLSGIRTEVECIIAGKSKLRCAKAFGVSSGDRRVEVR